MNEFIRSQWAKSKRSLAAAEATLDTDPDSAASRAYYAAFHGVTAVLAGRGIEFTKHTAVWAALHRDLIQSGAIPADLGRDYDFLLDLRETGDYGDYGDTFGGATRSVPEAGDPVLIKHRISTHDWNGLNQALSHEEPVKRIFVVEWQSSLPFGELQRDWGHCDAEVSQRPLHPLEIRQRQRKFLEACLDGEFPDRPDAYRQFNGGVFKDGSGTGTEPTRDVQRLDQGVGIQKMPHSMYSVKSSSGASKSGAMYRTVPFMVPSWR